MKEESRTQVRNSAGFPAEVPACVGQCQDSSRQCVPSHGELGKELQAEASMTTSRPAHCVFMDSGVTAVAITVRGSSVPVPKWVLGAHCLVELFLAMPGSQTTSPFSSHSHSGVCLGSGLVCGVLTRACFFPGSWSISLLNSLPLPLIMG